MTDLHKATDEQGAFIKRCSFYYVSSCIHELLCRVEILEATQHADVEAPRLREPPPVATDEELCQLYDSVETTAEHAARAGSLVEKVHSCIVGEPECGHMQARAAIREVADWLESRGNRGSAAELREEANRG